MKPEKDSYKLLIENLPDAFANHQIVVDSEGKPVDYIFLEVNQAFERMTGLKRETIIGKKVTDILPGIEKDDFDWIGNYGRVTLTGETIYFEQYSEPLGRFYQVTAYAVGKDCFSVIFKDLSDRKEKEIKEEALRKSQQQAQGVLDATNANVCVLDEHGYILSVNQSWLDFAKLNSGKIEAVSPGVNYLQVCDQVEGEEREMAESFAAGIRELIRGERDYFYKEYPCDAPGEKRWFLCEATSFLDMSLGTLMVVLTHLDITERKEAEANLKKIEWMLSQKQTPDSVCQAEDHYQGYGDLTELNIDGIILKSIGPELLRSFSNDYMELLGTSSAIYEINGDYAFGIFSSGWCRMMDRASRKLCDTTDNVEALNSGRWLCHESCWTDCSKEAIIKREQVDIECNGGMRIYAVPIFANGEVVGAINFGYGDPPKDREKLQKLADAYHINYNDLFREAHAYDTRPPYIIEMAKNRLHSTARLIGSMIETKQAEEEIRKSEEKYRGILSTIEEGYYEVDLAGNFVFFNDSLCKVLGYSRDELMQGSYKKLYKNPQDVFQTYNRVYRTGIAEKAADWPVITSDGREIFIEVSITLRRDEAGDPIGFRGIASDATERRIAEEKLREYEKLQQLLMDLATDLINVPLEKVDAAINEMLGAIGHFTKVDRVYIFNHDYNRRVTSNTHEWCAEGITAEIDNLQAVLFDYFPGILETHKKGEVVHIPDVAKMPEDHAMRPILEAQDIQSMVWFPLFSEGVNTGFVGFDAVKEKKIFSEQEIKLLKILAEITSNVLARQKTETKIRYMSFHDQLTGLYNRYFLEVEMNRLDTARQLPLAVIMADLNGLKLVNDTYGHEPGDQLLKTAADIIKNSCREEDIIARWGGDEFVILLPQTAAEEARLICKRIKEGCRGAFVEDMPVSIALGIATKTSETTSPIETLQEAENEMYRQKLTESRSTKSVVVTSLLNTLAEKSFETEKHTRGMQTIAQKIGAKLNLPDSELQRLELLITLHDIGKINISEAILTKKSSLTAVEWEVIKKHPEIGYRIAMATEEFAHAAEDILAHHERWDGTGYPQGLKGNEITLLARIVAIADAYEVMSHGRPYKKPMSKNVIIAEFKKCSGAQFDPELVEIFLSVMDSDA